MNNNRTCPDEEDGGNGQDAVVAYIQRFGGNCRDCADENGVCPSSGLPCADSDKAIRHVLKALEYGTKHGYLPTIPPGYVSADQFMDVDQLYADLLDLWAEANAVDTVIGRPAVLMAKITQMRDAIGRARNCRIPYTRGAVPGAAAAAPSQAAQDVLAERRRQIDVEGYDRHHDDSEHEDTTALARAAGCYLLHGDAYPTRGVCPAEWPWDAGYWKPKDRRRNAVRAAALALAEIERIDRAAPPSGGAHG